MVDISWNFLFLCFVIAGMPKPWGKLKGLKMGYLSIGVPGVGTLGPSYYRQNLFTTKTKNCGLDVL